MHSSLRFLFTSAYDWEAFVAEEASKNKVVGVVIAHRDVDDVWFIHEIAVLPDYRGKGIGAQLMEKMILYIKSKRGKELKLYVDAHNANAIELYKKLGFTVASQRNLMILNLS
ncbi:MAG: GNAT family N-acetyltransferase [candidate division WOR-3 bacterium]|nr:GNAT family N-acetyltransferase [candidate division WOR-3 bacterium]